MKRFPLFLLILFLPLLAAAQEKRVYTVSGGGTNYPNDGGPATAARTLSTEGVWLDGNCNMYFSDLGDNYVRKVNLETGIITTLAGEKGTLGGVMGFSGDGGPATAANIDGPYGLYADSIGNVYFADSRNSRIRKVDAVTGMITTVAGGGTLLGDGGPATAAELLNPSSVYVGRNSDIYISASARIRKVSFATGIITTVAGIGENGFSGDGGAATNAKIGMNPGTMLEDKHGNLIFADRGTSRIRRIDKSTGIITTLAGTTLGFSGDGGLATNAQMIGPISMAIDIDGNLLIGDNGGDCIRFVSATTGIITTVAGVGTTGGTLAEGALAMEAKMHPEFLYLDAFGNLFYSCFCTRIRKITGFRPGLNAHSSFCPSLNVVEITNTPVNANVYPNPAKDEITVSIGTNKFETIQVYNSIGQLLVTKPISSQSETIDVSGYVSGFYYLVLKGMQGTKTLSFTKN